MTKYSNKYVNEKINGVQGRRFKGMGSGGFGD